MFDWLEDLWDDLSDWWDELFDDGELDDDPPPGMESYD